MPVKKKKKKQKKKNKTKKKKKKKKKTTHTQKNRMTNSVDPDETARDEPSHLDLRCLQKCLFWSAVLKGLRDKQFGVKVLKTSSNTNDISF